MRMPDRRARAGDAANRRRTSGGKRATRPIVADNGDVTTPHIHRDLADLVARTISALDNARLPLKLPGSVQLNESRRRLRTQLATRILPHLRRDGLPTVVVFGGSSGAGKSTIFNSLLGKDISPASVIRPTTRIPVIAVNSEDAESLEGHAIVDMGRLEVVENAIPGLILVDAPDLDSVDGNNRELSRRLLDAADLWLFVTTASRYGDASAWQTLVDAHTRGMSAAVVLNRVPRRALRPVRRDLMNRMFEAGMGENPLLIVPDAGPHDAMLPDTAVKEIWDWLNVISTTHVGEALIERTSQAMLPDLRRQLLELAEAVEMQADSVQDLGERAQAAAADATQRITVNARMGRYGQGAPTTSWLSFASTGGALAGLVTGERPGVGETRRKTHRDEAAGSVFDGILNAVRVGIDQAVITVQAAIEKTWREDIVDTSDYRAAGARRVDADGIIEEALTGWKADLYAEASAAGGKPWFTTDGLASILGSAAGGVAGAEHALGILRLSGSLRPAREKLATRLEHAMARVVRAYTSVLDEIAIGNGRQLRLRASEYLDRV